MKVEDVNSIVNLLDDPDDEVYKLIAADLMTRGTEVVPILEDAWYHSANPTVQRRIENILHEIQHEDAQHGFDAWITGSTNDILQGAYWLAKFQYPNISLLGLTREVEQLRMNIWLSSDESLTPFEQLAIINRVLYDGNGYKVDPKEVMNPELCFINRLLENKNGNPISMGILYLAIAQRLRMPVYGVCIPNSFLLCYKGEANEHPTFYINAANHGYFLRREDVKDYISRLSIEPEDSLLEACTNRRVALRLIETLVYTYEQANETEKADVYRRLLNHYGEGLSSQST